MKIVIDEDIPFIKGVFEPYVEVVYLPGKQINSVDVKDADALIVRTRTKCNAALLNGSMVRCIASATIGYDHIDTVWCAENGVTWSNAAGCNAKSVGQYVLAALLEVANRLNFELFDKTIGIVGVGHVGSIVQQYSKLLGMQVLLNDPPREQTEGKGQFVSLDELAKESDIITFHTPLIRQGNYKTFHLLNQQFLQKLKQGVVIINSSRGEVIDEAVLKTARKNKQIAATVLDVWKNEPNIDVELLSMVNIATPHIAGYSTDGKARATEMAVRAVSHFFKLPLNNWVVNSLPFPLNSFINIDFTHKNLQQLLQKVVPLTYNIVSDDLHLRENITDFEVLRKHYPVRREFSSFTIATNKTLCNNINVLKQLGFNVEV